MNKRLSHIIASRHILAALMSLFLLSAATSCSEDENPEIGKATVKMTFSTRAGAQTGSTSALEQRERMHTLRVIMENATTHEILYNVFYENLQGGEKKVTFQDVPVEKGGTDFNFYAIANESSFLSVGESLAGKNVDLDALYKRDIKIDFNNNELPLPQAKKNHKRILPEKGKQEHTVKLEYPVAKIGVIFTNEIETEQTVTDIRIPNLKVNSGKLFPQDFGTTIDRAPQAETNAPDISFSPSPLPVPAGTFGGNPGKASVTSLYVYPAAGNSCTLNANWPDNNAKVVDLNQSGKLADGICRGLQLNVGVTLKYGVMQLNNLTVTVENWNNVFVTPEFQ